MTTSTNCKKCFFANKLLEDGQLINCEFYIPDAIKDTKKIELIEEYNYIHDYKCRYGISSEQAEKIITEFKIDNIKEYITTRVSIKYFLFIVVSETTNVKNVCDYITKLNIPPKAISIAFKSNTDIKSSTQICEEILKQNYNWKLHYFIETKYDHEMLSTSISTDERANDCGCILLANEQILKNITENDSINQINFIVNVQQPSSINILYPKNHEDYFYGLFTTILNLKGIYQQYGPDISAAIKQDCDSKNIGYYD